MIKEDWKKWPFLFKFRLFLGLILVIIISVFLYLKVVPFGHITYERDYGSRIRSGKGFIYGFTPAERVDLKSGDVPRLIGDPVYFSVFTPRTFDKAKLTIVYRDNLALDTPIVEAGVLVDNIVWRYDLKPVDNKALDYLMLRWNKIEENGHLFLQKEKKYNSLNDFENDLAKGELSACANPMENCLALYNYPLEYNYQIVNYHPAQPLTLNTPLRGTHQFYIYLNNEPLRLDFSFVDLNQDLKPAPIKVILSSASGNIIETKDISDENLNPGSAKIEEKELTLSEPSLPAGVYKVEIKITDDMVIKKIFSTADRLSFINKVWPVSSAGPLRLYTDSNYLQVKALNPASLQTINFSSEEFSLSEAYRQFDFQSKSNANIKEINLKKDDVILENNGVFAWSSESLFNPGFPKVDRFFSVKNPLQYIIADYKQPKEEEGYKTASLELNLKGAYREKGKYSFMISVPGLKTEDGTKDNLEIYQIKIELEGRTLWQKIWQ
ncbi:MAG: hypothetical protein WCN88_04180 [Candidatus Falkowbacteria bacterium]